MSGSFLFWGTFSKGVSWRLPSQTKLTIALHYILLPSALCCLKSFWVRGCIFLAAVSFLQWTVSQKEVGTDHPAHWLGVPRPITGT